MSGLSMKKFSSNQDGGSSLDFSHLAENPNFKPDAVEPTGQEPTGAEPTGQEPSNQEPTGGDPANNNPSGEEPSGSSLKPNDGQEPSVEEPKVTDELILKALSEKLGKEVTFESLGQEPQELDPDIKAISDWKTKTGRPLEDFFKYQRDFSEVSDEEIVREYLQIEYPSFTKEEIEMELSNYISDEDDFDEDKAKKTLELKKLALKGREVLKDMQTELSKPSDSALTPEMKQKIEFADSVQQYIADDKANQEKYMEGITASSLGTESMKLNLSDELSIDFSVSEEDRKALPTLINEMPHWKNEDGSWNHQAVVEDAIKIQHFDKMLRLAFEQGLNSGKEDIIAKSKNVNLGDPSGAPQGTQSKKPIIEGIDKILGKQGLKVRKFGN